ncbi:MAG TPA: hypothetical protein VF418_04660 [Sphingomonadaceae bacterium]
MNRFTIAALAIVATLGWAAPASAQFFGGGPCDRGDLQQVAEKYIQAQRDGKPGDLPFGNEWVDYKENNQVSTMYSGGIIGKPQKIDWYRLILDPDECKFMAEIIITDPAHPYVLATQASVAGGTAMGPFDTIVTDAGDWLFDANYTLKYAKSEDWSVIPEAERNTRKELIAAADAYLNSFKDKSIQVPWGTPCDRLEGSAYTGNGSPTDSCNVGVPEGVDLVNRQYVVDPTIGAVDVFMDFGKNQRADSHLFRIEHGKIRYVHTVTNCGDSDNCGFDSFKKMLEKNPKMHPDLVAKAG